MSGMIVAVDVRQRPRDLENGNSEKGGKPRKASNETEAGISAVVLAEAGEHGIALQAPDTRAAKKKKVS